MDSWMRHSISLDVAVELFTMINQSIQDSIKTVWFCNRCKSFIQRKIIQQFNKMKVVDIPSVLMGLNTLEQHLISKATVFMKIVILPRGGQRAVRGQVITSPSNVDSVISELPHLPNREDIVYIQQPQSPHSHQKMKTKVMGLIKLTIAVGALELCKHCNG